MFYEEKWINGVLYCRSNPRSPWQIKAGCTPAPDDETPMPPPWTPEDDKKLALLLDRKARAEQVKFDRVLLVVDEFPYCGTNHELAEALIYRATAIRAALKPYDKEVR